MTERLSGARKGTLAPQIDLIWTASLAKICAGTKLVVTAGLVAMAGFYGSVYASVYASRLTATMPTAVAAPVAAIAHQSVGAAYVAAGRSRPSAIRPWDWRCIMRPPTRSCAVSPSAPSSPAASPYWGPSWPYCSCPLSQRP